MATTAKTPNYIPSVRAMQLARYLRIHRERAKLRVGEAAAALDWSQGKVSHLESGRNKAKPADVELMLELYGVTSPERDEILALANEADRRNWWAPYTDVLQGPFVALEDGADEIREWAPLLIPGLLQTPDYARAIMTRDDYDIAGIEHRLQARKNRQIILGRNNPPTLRVILAELILHREVGNRFTMRAQLRKLLDESSRPNVTVQIVPRNSQVLDGLDGAFTVFGFSTGYPDVAYAEGFHGSTYLESPPQIERCNVAYERLRGAALNPQESTEMISVAAQHT
jgi:hypothetical protein